MLQHDTGSYLQLWVLSVPVFWGGFFIPEWYIMAVASLSILGVLAFPAIMATILLCYMRRSEKTPAVLVSTLNYKILRGITVM